MITFLGIIGWIAFFALGIIFWPSYLIYWFLAYDYVDVSFRPIEAFGGFVLVMLLLILQIIWFAIIGAISD